VRGDSCTVANGPGGVTVGGVPLTAFAVPAEYRVAGVHPSPTADTSDRVRLALQQLHAGRRFTRVEFPADGGLGLRSVQAKRAGLAFADVTLAVRLDTCGAWRREAEQRWPRGYDEVEADFAERWAFEHADERVTPDAKLLEYVKRLGWGGCTSPSPSASEGTAPTLARARARTDAPLVTVGIAHFNLGRYLPETLAALAAQTYPHVEVIAIDDGSADPASVAAFAEMEARYPRWRFFRQANAGIGATRNRCLELARGEFFIPVDADNLPRPEMVERFVTAAVRNPHLAAMSCYFLAFADGAGNPPAEFLHALRPTGGPHILAGIRNVYGDANAVFRTDVFRAAGGYGTDRGTSCEDWEAFVKLVHAGHRIGVIPEHLFYYRHLPGGFSRRTNWYANHNRVLRHFTGTAGLTPEDAAGLWAALLGFHQRIEQLENAAPPRRHRVADAVHSLATRVRRVFRRGVRS
jgi:GT2 family glycosyltransferase